MRDLLLLNTSHYQGGNTYRLKFPTPIDIKKAKLSLSSFSIYNSTYNITSEFQNNIFSITWLGQNYNFVIPDGYYSISDLNYFIQQQCLLNKLYMTKNNGSQNVYFIEITTNSVRYKAQINMYYIPTSTEATTLQYSIPAGASWTFPLSNQTPQLNISVGLGKILGMTEQLNFPQVIQPSNYSKLSDTYPRLSPVFTYLLTCNLLSSAYNPVPTIFAQIPITASFGAMITKESGQFQEINIRESTYNEIMIQLWDQEYNPLKINDPDMSLVMVLDSEK